MGMGMLGAMAGLGQAGQDVGKQMMAAALREDEMKFLQQRQEALMAKQEEMKIRMADRARTDQVARVAEAKNGLINQALGQKYAGSDEAVAAADAGQTDLPLSDEQRAVIEQAKGGDRAKLASDPSLDVQAAHASGDLSSKEYGAFMLNERRQDRADKAAGQKTIMDQLKYELEQRKVDIRDKQVMGVLARVASSGGGGAGAASAFVQGLDKLMALGKTKDEAITIMTSAKTPGESFSRTEEIDPLTGDPKVKTVRKGPGSGPVSKLDELFPAKK